MKQAAQLLRIRQITAIMETLVNMTAPACWVAGQIGNALNFDGVNDLCPIPGLLNQPSSISICAWVNLSSPGIHGAEIVYPLELCSIEIGPGRNKH